MFYGNYLDSVHHNSSLAVEHFVDKYSANVVRTLADFQEVVDIHLVDVLKLLVAFHDDKLEAQHSVHILVVHTVALPVDSYLADILVLK